MVSLVVGLACTALRTGPGGVVNSLKSIDEAIEMKARIIATQVHEVVNTLGLKLSVLIRGRTYMQMCTQSGQVTFVGATLLSLAAAAMTLRDVPERYL